jgi:hypothetical protein
VSAGIDADGGNAPHLSSSRTLLLANGCRQTATLITGEQSGTIFLDDTLA